MKKPYKQFTPTKQTVTPSSEKGLGTFGGVFTPSILTILGVIMYLRFGWVVGNAGLIGTLLIVTMSTSITFLTALSISAIATDQTVRTGGAYYMISRSLGIESGGAIGIPLYFAQALSVALYTVGFAESVVTVFPALPFKLVGVITTIVVAALAMISAKAAIRAQYFIMAGIALSLLSLVLGSPIETSQVEMWGASPENSESFWVVFAVFFPAVTGIMAGVNLSGDLKDPGKSIPRGTFLAIGVGYLIYMLLPIVLANRADALTLIEDPLIMRKISYWGNAILIGVWGATLSSAVGSILGAPRVLQALSRDGVLPSSLSWVGKGHGEDDSPRLGTLLTLGVALVAVLLGNLNIIAPILTMFFLTTYGVLNVTAGTERLLKSPSFRPKFKVHWAFSLIGALGCIAVMFLINALATLVAFIFIAMIFVWLQRRELQTSFGDVRNGIWMEVTRAGLLRMSRKEQAKTWRPQPLVLSGAPTKRWHLIDFASSLTHNRGLMTVAMVITTPDLPPDRQQASELNIQRFLTKRGVRSLVRCILADDPFTGAEMLVKAYGLGAMVPNTVILGNNENTDTLHDYCSMIESFHHQNRNVLVVYQDDDQLPFGDRRKIDVWWGGLKGNGGLMMILAHLIQTTPQWWNADVTVKMIVQDEKGAEVAQENLENIILRIRTNFGSEVIRAEGRSFNDIIHESSSHTDLVFLGLAKPENMDDFTDYFKSMQKRLRDMPTTILALATEEDVSYGHVLMQEDVWDRI